MNITVTDKGALRVKASEVLKTDAVKEQLRAVGDVRRMSDEQRIELVRRVIAEHREVLLALKDR